MKISNLSNVIYVTILLLNIEALEFTLNVFMKISSNTSVIFAKRALDRKVHSKTTLKCANKKPFKCDFCDYAAFKQSHIRRHIECVHEKLKQHQCCICHQSFGRKGTLNKHVQSVHENIKPFKCTVIYVIIQLSIIKTSEDTLNVFMKISSNINVPFVKGALVGKVHSKCIL
jgi:uncharacterized Zn-finger protein